MKINERNLMMARAAWSVIRLRNRRIKSLEIALNDLMTAYVVMAVDGGPGSWDPTEDDVYIIAKSALNGG